MRNCIKGRRVRKVENCCLRSQDCGRTAAVHPLSRSTVLQQQYNRVGKVEHGSVALPAIMRSGASGPENFQVGSMPPAQQQITSGQMHRGHMPPLVRVHLLLHGPWVPLPSVLSKQCFIVLSLPLTSSFLSSKCRLLFSLSFRLQPSRRSLEPLTPACRLCRLPRLLWMTLTHCPLLARML